MTTHDEIERAALALNRLDMPDTAALIRRLRDERDEAKAQLEKAREALEPLNGYAGKDFQAVPGDIIVYVRLDIIRAAARVHAEAGEKGPA